MFTNEKPGGHGERSVAIGTIDMAVWDAVAKIEGKPLFQLLADRYGNGKPNRKIFVYAAGGYYYPGQDHDKLKDEMRSYIDRGYTVVKKKIGGASLDEDLRRIDSILSVLQDGQKLCVDANGRFDLDTAIAYAKALSQYDLFWYEEPGDPLDFELQATLRNYYKNPMATGEDLFSMQDARNLIRYGGMRPDRDWLQFDCALSYGLVEYLRTLDMLKEHGWSASRCIPHGGHQMSLNIAAGLGLGGNESLPRPVPAVRRLPRRREGREQLRHAARPARHRLRRQGRPVPRDAGPVGLSQHHTNGDNTMTFISALSRAGRPWPPLAHRWLAADPDKPVTLVVPFSAGGPTRQDRARPRRSPAQAAGPDGHRRQHGGRRRHARHGAGGCARRRTATRCWSTTSAWPRRRRLYKNLAYKNEQTRVSRPDQRGPVDADRQAGAAGDELRRAAQVHRRQRRQDQPRQCRRRLGVAPVQPLAAERAEERHGLRALQGHGTGDERPARRTGRPDVRAGDQQHAADRGEEGQGVRRHERRSA